MNSQNTTIEEAKALIREAKNILLLPSSPDGDSIGSSLALLKVFQKMGKKAMVVSMNEVPDYLQFLPYTGEILEELPQSNDFVITLSTQAAEVDHLKYEMEADKIKIIVTPKQGEFTAHDVQFPLTGENFDLIITVDTGDLVQLGGFYEDHQALFKKLPVLNIDHHASNGRFGTHNLLDLSVASTTQMLTPMIMDFEKETGQTLIDEDVATLLLVGIITDTGSFQHSNTTPEAFEVAADLLERGARQQDIIKRIFKTKSLATLKLWGRVLSKIKYEPETRLVYSTITQADLDETGADIEDSGGIIDELMSNAPQAEVVMLLKEKEKGFVGGSFRAPGELADVSEIAQLIGGGGHKKAAGFRIRDKSMDEALALAKQTVANYMASKLGSPEPTGGATPLFPGLSSHPGQATQPIPKANEGGEDLLLKDFRNRQATPEEEAEQRVQEASARFFQDADGQVKFPGETPVGDVLDHLKNQG